MPGRLLIEFASEIDFFVSIFGPLGNGKLSSGSEKGVFWKRGLFRKVHFLEILENLEILEFLESPQTVENKGGPDHFLEILENLEILEHLEIRSVKRPLS